MSRRSPYPARPFAPCSPRAPPPPHAALHPHRAEPPGWPGQTASPSRRCSGHRCGRRLPWWPRPTHGRTPRTRLNRHHACAPFSPCPSRGGPAAAPCRCAAPAPCAAAAARRCGRRRPRAHSGPVPAPRLAAPMDGAPLSIWGCAQSGWVPAPMRPSARTPVTAKAYGPMTARAQPLRTFKKKEELKKILI